MALVGLEVYRLVRSQVTARSISSNALLKSSKRMSFPILKDARVRGVQSCQSGPGCLWRNAHACYFNSDRDSMGPHAAQTIETRCFSRLSRQKLLEPSVHCRREQSRSRATTHRRGREEGVYHVMIAAPQPCPCLYVGDDWTALWPFYESVRLIKKMTGT